MKLFEKYEKLKNSNELIPIGSVWASSRYTWRVHSIEDDIVKVLYIKEDMFFKIDEIYSYYLPRFRRIFTRIK